MSTPPPTAPAKSRTRSGKGGKKAPRRSTKGDGSGGSDARALFADRLARLRKALGKQDADAMVVTSPLDVGYLTGFLGGDSWLVVGKSGAPVLISDFRYAEELEHFADRAKIEIRPTGETMIEATARTLESLKSKHAAVQGEHMTISTRHAFAKRVGKKHVVDTDGIVLKLRRTKDASEVRLLHNAIRLQEKALTNVLPTIEPGMTELAIAARLEAEMRTLGAQQASFETIIAAGATSAMPHYRPANRKVRARDVLLIDWGARKDGYGGDMTRTFAIGAWPKVMREVYEIVREAHMLAAEALKPGARLAEVDAVARGHIARHGYGERFGHSLGHGIGLAVHEQPSLSSRAGNDVLKPGDVVTNEPGIYLPGVGGVRLEDDYAIGDKGAKKLSSLPMDLRWATLG
ncbi:MAG: Xaa-Pro peptidase family protein [Phycisphaerales bacterium]|jgi:Xaa-Pro aminopeptidase|nr:Xaa-Pro peptidase family protein [Phycisphaerales bacterium]